MSAPPPLRIGVAGLGKMGLLHAAIFNSLPGSRVTAVADPSGFPRGVLTGAGSAARVYAGFDEMLKARDVDAVVIATPVAEHIRMATACVEAGLPFLMEKPLATSADEALTLAVALEKKPVPHMIGFMARHVASFATARDVIASGCLGRLHRLTATIYVSQLFTKGQGWRYDRKLAGGGVLLSQGSHLLDLLTWYFGPVRRVNAEVASLYSAEIEDLAHVMVEFGSGLRGWVDCSWSVRFRRMVETTIDVEGENGALHVTDDDVRLFLDGPAGGRPAGWTTWNAVELYRGVEVDMAGPQYTREDEVFLDALRTGKAPAPDFRQAFHVQQIVDAAYASAARDASPQTIDHA